MDKIDFAKIELIQRTMEKSNQHEHFAKMKNVSN